MALEFPSDLEDREGLKKLGLPYISSSGWLAVGTFFLRTWFRRIWVLQETFAAKNPIVSCGTHILGWAKITAVNEGTEGTRHVANTINIQSVFGDITKDNASFLNLETLLAYSRYFGATKAQDRVYAMRGM
jgi:hypothetical protein